MSRPLLLSLVPLALLLAACGQEKPPVASVRPAMVVHPQSTSPASASYPGEVRARYEPQLAFRVAGKVTRRLVEEGDRVKVDQPLAELDPQDVRLQLEAARAQVAAAQANQNLAQAELDRYKTLLERQMVSHSLYDSAQNQFSAAQARLRQVKAEFDVASNQASYAVLRAPQAGVINSRSIEVGQVVAAGQTAFVLAADGEREVAINLPEQRFAGLRVGQPVTVQLWSQGTQRYPGHVRELSPSADPRSRTYAARIALDAAAPAQMGQSAQVFVGAGQAAVLSVPLAALTSENGINYVWRLQPGNHLQRVAVRTGAYAEESVPVLEGLLATDWVVAAGVHVLHEGEQVRPVDRDNRAVHLADKE